VPQINILAIGFNVNALLTVVGLCVTLGTIAWAFPERAVDALDLLRDAVREAAEIGLEARS
jgi:flagellar biosynthesis protein FliR